MKRLLIVTYEFPPLLGGAGSYASDLAVGLSKVGHKVDIVTYTHNTNFTNKITHYETNYGISFYTIQPLKGLHFFQFFLKVKQVVSKTNYDTIILSDARAKKTFAFFAFALKNYFSKSISIIHGNEINQFFKQPTTSIKFLGINKSMYRLFKAQHKIITVSKNEALLWRSEFSEFSDKIEMINHGINSDIFFKRDQQDVTKIKTNLGLPEDKVIFLTASRLTKPKGQDTLITAFHKVLKQHENCMLVICGDGEYRKALEDQVDELQLYDDVIFTGSLNRELLSEYYAAASVFILVSRYEEALGLVYLEAAACGCTSIGGHLGGVKDVVKHNETGYIVNSNDVEMLADKLNYILDHPDVLHQLQEQALSMFNQGFTCEVMANNLCKTLYF